MVNREKLARLIIELRNKKGYSQRKLAMISGISNSTISRIENATSDADPETLRKLAPYLGISYETLMEAAGYIESESNKEYIESKGEQNQLPDSYVIKIDSKDKADSLADEIIKILVETGEITEEELQSGNINPEKKKKLLSKVKKAIKASQIFEQN